MFGGFGVVVEFRGECMTRVLELTEISDSLLSVANIGSCETRSSSASGTSKRKQAVFRRRSALWAQRSTPAQEVHATVSREASQRSRRRGYARVESELSLLDRISILSSMERRWGDLVVGQWAYSFNIDVVLLRGGPRRRPGWGEPVDG